MALEKACWPNGFRCPRYDGRNYGIVCVYQPPQYGNANVLAQDSLFTFHRTLAEQHANPELVPTEESLIKLLAHHYHLAVGDKIPTEPWRLVKLTLPAD